MSNIVLGPERGSLSKISAEVLHLGQTLSPFHKDGQHVLIACFPKSGSTYLSNMIQQIMGFERVGFVEAYAHNEQDISRNVIRRHRFKNTVSQHHVKGTPRNVALLKHYDVKTIILTRDIHDVIMSIRDHIINEDHRSPLGYVPTHYFDMSESEKLTFIIRIMVPWYFSFYMSWLEAAQTEFDVKWVRYEDLFGAHISSMQDILSFCGTQSDEDIIEAASETVKKNRARFNVGKSGRGDANLNASHKKAIRDIALACHLSPELLTSIGIS